MGAFEDFVNANLGIRKPIITDAGVPSLSSKAAGIIGSQYIDSDTQFLYEKTGENNSDDWVKIAYIGQTRGQPPEGIEGSVQFKSGDFFAGSPNLNYNYSAGLLSGQSGDFNYIYTNFITGETGHFGQEVAIGDPAEDDVFVVDNGNIETAGRANFSGPISGPSIAVTTGSFDKLIINGTNIEDSLKNYPVVTGGGFNSSTNILSLFRDLGAASIEIDLSSLAGGGSTYQSTLLWEENNGDLVLLNDETTTSYPATQLFENSGDNAYTVREDTFGSNTEAAQYFKETGVDITLTASSFLPPIPSAPAAVSTQWFQEDGSDQLLMRETLLATSNPAVQLWEPTGVDQYTPRPEPFSSTTESAQYFQETGVDKLTTI